MTSERTYRGVPAEERRAQRRAQLLQAALEVWGGGEPAHVTMTGVCQAAQLTERYFYESFTQLDDALVAVVDMVADQIQQATIVALAEAGSEPLDRVTAVVTAFARTLIDDPRKGRAALVESQAFAATRPRREVLVRRLARLAAREARKIDGHTPWTDDEGSLLSTMFVGGVVQLVTSALDDGTPTERIVETSRRTFSAIVGLP